MLKIIELILLTAVIVCGVIDYKKYIIPNIITIPLIIAGLIMQIYYQNWTNILFGVTAGFVVLILAAITGGIGGGDIKLIFAMFLWLFPSDCLNIIITSCSIGIMWGIVKKIKAVGWQKAKDVYYKKAVMWSAMGIRSLDNHGVVNNKNEIVPFGTCIALGLVIYYIYVYFIW